MSAPTPDFKELSGRMRRQLTRIARQRRVVRALLVIVYSATLLWFVFCFFGNYLLASADYTTYVHTSQYILYGFVLFCVLHFAFMRGLQSLGERETALMGRIVGESAALLFTSGIATNMPDGVLSHVMSSGRTLAVHMYALLSERSEEHTSELQSQ